MESIEVSFKSCDVVGAAAVLITVLSEVLEVVETDGEAVELEAVVG